MRVPILDEIRATSTEAEYVAILELAGDLIALTANEEGGPRIVGLALTAAAAMYAEALKQSAPILGRGPGGN